MWKVCKGLGQGLFGVGRPIRAFRTSSSSSSSSSSSYLDIAKVDLETFGRDKIRNFSIIAHIDHGKSTLADRLLEHVGSIQRSKENARILDTLKVEKERGITVKAQTASMLYRSRRDGQPYLLNMIDTPGHVDFNSEVSRSLLACQGVLLLVDANQGVQAQTVSNFFMAFAQDLTVVPVLNKIDLPGADPEGTKEQLSTLFDLDPDQVLLASAKHAIGIEDIFEAVVDRIPPPAGASGDAGHNTSGTRVLLQDCWYDPFRGTVNLVQVVDGRLQVHEEITSMATGLTYPVKTLGLLTPEERPVRVLYPGQIGVMTCNMKTPKDAIIGDTYFHPKQPVEAIVKVRRPTPMVFAGIYPMDSADQAKLTNAIEKVCLNDCSVSVTKESSPALGLGWRVGCLGLLHLEVFTQRLEDEYDAQVLVTTPSVPYKLTLREKSPYAKKVGNTEVHVYNPTLWPPSQDIVQAFEPVVLSTIVCPQDYLGDVFGLCAERRGVQKSFETIDQTRVKMEFHMPLNEVVVDFFDTLKSLTSGYGSFDYEDAGYQESNLVKVDFLLNDKPVEELGMVVHASNAREKGNRVVEKLVEHLPRQQYKIKVQAAVGSKILARGDIKPFRKDVTAKCYGGDMSRKMKLLKYQAEGKKRLRSIGNIEVSKDTFIKLLT